MSGSTKKKKTAVVIDYIYIVDKIDTDNEETTGDIIIQNIGTESQKQKFITLNKLNEIVNSLEENKENFICKKKIDIVKYVYKSNIYNKLIQFEGEEPLSTIYKLIINEDSKLAKILKEKSLININRDGINYLYDKINSVF